MNRNGLEGCFGGRKKLQPLLCGQYRLQNHQYMRFLLEYVRKDQRIRMGQEIRVNEKYQAGLLCGPA